MENKHFLYVVSLMSMRAAIVDALLRGQHYEFHSNNIDRDLKYTDTIKQLQQKDELTKWDRQMDAELDAKYKELFYTAFAARDKELEHVRQMVIRHIQVNRPKVSNEALEEIKSLKKTEVKGPANWNLIKASTKLTKA